MKKIYSMRRKWKEKMRLFLGLCPNCGKETNIYIYCNVCRKKYRKKRVCKVPFCENIVQKGVQFCNEHILCRYYPRGKLCKVSFNYCKYCGQLFTAKQSHNKTCRDCNNKHMQAKVWKSENIEKVRESGKKSYHKRKDNADFKAKQKASRIKNKPRTDKYFKKYNKTEKRAALSKEHNKKRLSIPGNRERAISGAMYSRLFLSDGYMIEKISRQFKIKKESVIPEMIVIKRDLLIKERLTKELNNVINCKRDQRVEGITH